jgi:hypothetical protein
MSMPGDVAPPQRPDPSMKVEMAKRIGHLRPKMLANWPYSGWTIVLVEISDDTVCKWGIERALTM